MLVSLAFTHTSLNRDVLSLQPTFAMLIHPQTCILLCIHTIRVVGIISASKRREIVRSFNPHRNASSSITPLQVGNGDFAFGADITGLQTFSRFSIQSSWAWHNFSLPTVENQTSLSGISNFPSPSTDLIRIKLAYKV